MKHKITYIKYLAAMVTFFCVVTFGYGQVVAWEMDGITGSVVTFDATTLSANLNTSTLSRGSGLIASSLQNALSSNNFTVAGTQADAITNNDYLQFQVSASNGYEVSLSTLDANFRRTGTGPNSFIWRYSTDSVNFTDIGTVISYTISPTNGTTQAQIDLSVIPALQNVAFGTTITFRLFGWGATGSTGSFAIGRLTGNDLSLGVVVSALPCSGTPVTYNGVWSAIPDLTTPVTIETSYDTSLGSFQACSLTVNPGVTLNVNNNTFVEVQNDVTIDGTISVQTKGNFVQYGNTFTINAGGLAFVNKRSATKLAWYYYTYWSSPVSGETIDTAFPDAPVDRRFWYDANSYLDIAPLDGIDDNGDDWKLANGVDPVIPGVGYAVTSSLFGPPFPRTDLIPFNGVFNTGDIPTAIIYNAANTEHWNFIGNPYPSAIDFIAFQAANSSVIDGTAYFWSQATPPDATNPGNEVSNFSQNDYATFVVGTGGTAGGDPLLIPTQYIPSGQGFFIVGLDNANATFTNSMRMADVSSNNQFFKSSNSKKTSTVANKLWINLKSDNGVFNQILVGYVKGATNSNDGLMYDAPRNLSAGAASILYTNIENSNRKFVIQGKAENSLTEDEVITIGFKTTIDVPTIYTLSIAQLEGDFLNGNPIYLKDNLLNTLHNLKDSDYNFTSTVGEFNTRFEIVFDEEALSLGNQTITLNDLSIIELRNGDVQFKLSGNLAMTSIKIIDLQGRVLYHLEAEGNNKTYNLSNLSQAPYLAKVTLSNGNVITKKAIKRF